MARWFKKFNVKTVGLYEKYCEKNYLVKDYLDESFKKSEIWRLSNFDKCGGGEVDRHNSNGGIDIYIQQISFTILIFGGAWLNVRGSFVGFTMMCMCLFFFWICYVVKRLFYQTPFGLSSVILFRNHFFDCPENSLEKKKKMYVFVVEKLSFTIVTEHR